jgi:hypothetical protein
MRFTATEPGDDHHLSWPPPRAQAVTFTRPGAALEPVAAWAGACAALSSASPSWSGAPLTSADSGLATLTGAA